jgi:outer membrane protein assembly factor BamB
VFDWSAEQETPKSQPPRPKVRREDDSDIPIRTRRQGLGLTGKVTLIALSLLLVATIGGTVAFFFLGKMRSEEQEATAADALYKDGKFAEAKRKFDTLAVDYPDSSALPKYLFFAALAQTQADASSVTIKDDPSPAQRSLQALLATYGDSPLAQPNSGFGADVVVVGRKVADAFGEVAAEQVKRFQADRSKLSLLDDADKTIREGRDILPTLEKFRDKSGLTLDDLRKKFDDVEVGVRKERDRLATLAPWRNLPDDPTDVRIDQFEKAMKASGLENDGEALALAVKAKTVLRGRVKYEPEPKAAGSPPLDVGAMLTVVPRVAGSPDIKQVTGKRDVVFGVAQGMLYAVDSRTGAKLWGERVSAETLATAPPLRVSLADGNTDWVLVPGVRAGQAGLTARRTLTGEADWHQVLPAPVLGRPVLVGERLIVPLADAIGTLLLLNVTDGTQLGKVELHQSIGGGIAALRGSSPNHGFVVVPADARRVFVFEVGKPGDDGRRQDPRWVRVFATNHPRGSLRGAPLVIDPDDPAVPRRVILAQTEGPAGMKLRSFHLPPPAELAVPSADGDTPPAQMAEAGVVGWPSFPPASDGERVVVCTDKGAFAAFGINQPGQADKPLYQLPAQTADPDPTAFSPSQVVVMDEDSYWVILNGKLSRLRVASDPRDGQKIVPAIDARLIGEPVAAPQVRPADKMAVITTKATASGTIHLTAYDTETGEVRWQRQLGALTVAPTVSLADGSRLLVDTCGGVYRTTPDSTELVLVEKCEPKPGCASPAVTALSADGSRLWVAVNVSTAEGMRLFVRTFKNGKPEGDERLMKIPAGLAGNAVAVGDFLLFPLANQFLYRVGLKDTEPTQGPAWGGPKTKPEAVCHLSAGPDGTFVFGDGNTQLLRRKWAVEKPEAEKVGGPWELLSPATGPTVTVIAEGKEFVIAADGSGVAVFDPAKPTADPVRRWQEGNSQRAGSLVTFDGRAAWAVNGRAVAVAAPGNDKPDWVFPLPADAGEVVGLTRTVDGLLVTGSSGVVIELSAAGEVTAEAALPAEGPLVKMAAVKIGNKEVLVPLADGTVSRLLMQKR